MFRVLDEKLLKNLDVQQKKIARNLYNAMQMACNIVVDNARSIVPVDTGFLRDHIDFNVNIIGKKIIGEIGTMNWPKNILNYSAFVELGTSRMRARPYLRPALVKSRERILKIFKNIVR